VGKSCGSIVTITPSAERAEGKLGADHEREVLVALGEHVDAHRDADEQEQPRHGVVGFGAR
jgi:hypothetical protein